MYNADEKEYAVVQSLQMNVKRGYDSSSNPQDATWLKFSYMFCQKCLDPLYSLILASQTYNELDYKLISALMTLPFKPYFERNGMPIIGIWGFPTGDSTFVKYKDMSKSALYSNNDNSCFLLVASGSDSNTIRYKNQTYQFCRCVFETCDCMTLDFDDINLNLINANCSMN